MNRLARLALVLVAVAAPLLVSGCASTPHVPRSTSFPASYTLPMRTCGTYFLADVELDGVPATLVFDTGAAGVHLAHEVVREHRRQTGRSNIDTIRFGDYEATNFAYYSLDFSNIQHAFGEPIHGIIGYQFFRDALLVVDYPAMEVRLEPGSLDADDARTVKYGVDRRGAPFLPFTVGDATIPMLLDIGAQGGIHITSIEGVEFAGEPMSVGRGIRAHAKYEQRAGRMLQDASFGPIEIEQPIVTEAPAPALIGQSILHDFVVTFDQRQRLVKLDGPGRVSVEPRRGTGLSLEMRPTDWIVIGYDETAPAAQSGIQPVDRIIAVDGIAIEDLGCERFERDPGTTTITYTIERGLDVFDVAVPIGVLVE